MAGNDKSDKKGLKYLFAAASIAGFGYLMAPAEQHLMPEHESGPNEVQQEFIRLVAQKYDYVLLGDTGHDEPRVGIFATHTDMVGALADGGKERLFLEAGPRTESYFEKVAKDPAIGPTLSERWADRTMWLCSDTVRDAYSASFEKSIYENQTIRFTGVDQRHAPGSEANEYMNGFAMKYVVGIPLSLYSLTYGCVTSKAFFPSSLVLALVGHDIGDGLVDDRETAAAILSYPEKSGAIFYGAGHFVDWKKLTMKSQIAAQGYSIGHINIYMDEKGARSEKELGLPDVYLYVNEEQGDYGIDPLTIEMTELRDQAVQNVNARKQLAPQI